METIAFNLERYTSKKEHQPRNEREEMYDKFLAKINPPRVENGFSKITHKRLAKVLEKIPTSDLYPFYRKCEEADHFSKMFWYLLKPKP